LKSKSRNSSLDPLVDPGNRTDEIPREHINMVHRPRRLSYEDELNESNNDQMMEDDALLLPARRQRRGLRRIPNKVFHSISSGVRKGAKLMRGNRRRGNRSRSRRSAGTGEISHPSMPPSRANHHVRSLSSRTVNFNSFAESEMPVHDVVDQGIDIDDMQSQVLVQTETFLRYLLVLIGVYLLGMQQPIEFSNPAVVWNIGYVVGIAWTTCFIIRFVSLILSDRSDYLTDEEVPGSEQEAVQREPIHEMVHNQTRRVAPLNLVDEESDIDEEEAEESPDDLMSFDNDGDLQPSVQGQRRRTRNSKQGRL